MTDVCIIGGGAAGLLAAITAAKRGKTVTIIEKNKILGRKILSTGNGRCNFTNRFMKASCFYSDDQQFVEAVISRMGCMDIIKFFDELGVVPRYINDLVYPMTNQAKTIVAVLEKEINRLDIKVILDTAVNKIEKNNDVFTLSLSNESEIEAKKVIAAFGGKAAPALGSDGSGNKLLRGLGHSISFTYPALVGLKSKDERLKSLAGLRNIAKVELFLDNVSERYEEGEVQFNADGISGFPVMQLSRFASRALSEKKVDLSIDFVPFLTRDQLKEYIDCHKDIKGIVPENAWFLFENLSGEELLNSLKDLRFNIYDTYGFNQAQVTMGGVKLSEVNPSTMMSKIVDGLYLAGELLDVDGRCGGYNLSFAFATGYIAGLNI